MTSERFIKACSFLHWLTEWRLQRPEKGHSFESLEAHINNTNKGVFADGEYTMYGHMCQWFFFCSQGKIFCPFAKDESDTENRSLTEHTCLKSGERVVVMYSKNATKESKLPFLYWWHTNDLELQALLKIGKTLVLYYSRIALFVPPSFSLFFRSLSSSHKWGTL